MSSRFNGMFDAKASGPAAVRQPLLARAVSKRLVKITSLLPWPFFGACCGSVWAMLAGQVHGMWVASPGAWCALHPSWCRGCGAAGSMRSTSCAQRACSACTRGARSLCLSAGATRRFGASLKVNGRGAGDRALGVRAIMTADAGSAPVARWGVAKVGGGWDAGLLEIAAQARPMIFQPKKFRHSHGHHSGVRYYFSTIFAALKSA